MKIGELATRTGTPAETIRHYERQGLLPAPPRTESNYRVYTADHERRLAFIRRCRSLDMNLGEVRELLACVDAQALDCAPVAELLDRHVRHVQARIDDLRELQRELTQLRTRCEVPGATADCGIVAALSAEPSTAVRRRREPLHPGGAHSGFGVEASPAGRRRPARGH